MTKPRSDTRQRIQDIARELFPQKGVQRTSLQDIADRLGITKPALYYHFSSREELVRSILQPLIDDGERFVADHEGARLRATPRELLEGYFDFHYRYRADLVLVVAEFTTLADLGLIDRLLAWRERLSRLVFGPEPTLAAVDPRRHRLRRAAGLLPAVSRRTARRAATRDGRRCHVGSRNLGWPRLESRPCASDSSSRKAGDSIWSASNPASTGR